VVEVAVYCRHHELLQWTLAHGAPVP
jgi:hypothetical protein